jgi:hypothetical protein
MPALAFSFLASLPLSADSARFNPYAPHSRHRRHHEIRIEQPDYINLGDVEAIKQLSEVRAVAVATIRAGADPAVALAFAVS